MIKVVGDGETKASTPICTTTPKNGVTLFLDVSRVQTSNLTQGADIYIHLFDFPANNCSGKFWSYAVLTVVCRADIPGCQI